MNAFRHKTRNDVPAGRSPRRRAVLVLTVAWLLAVAPGVFGMQAGDYGKEAFTLPEKQVSVGDLVRYAYENNPSIVEARESWNATIERFRLETGYPEPKLTVTYFPEPIETR